jgi:cytochrome c oxidase subunit 2
MSDRGLALAIFILGGLLFVLLPAFRPSETGESVHLPLAELQAKIKAQETYATGKSESGVPIVRPPSGDVYLLARRWEWTPLLELEAGKTYRLHVTTEDVGHGFHLTLGEIDRLLAPGIVETVPLAPARAGSYQVICSDYCGGEHNAMQAPVRVYESGLR